MKRKKKKLSLLRVWQDPCLTSICKEIIIQRVLASAQGAQGSKNPAIRSIASSGKEGDGSHTNPKFRTAKSSRTFSFPDSPLKKCFGHLLLSGSSGTHRLDYHTNRAPRIPSAGWAVCSQHTSGFPRPWPENVNQSPREHFHWNPVMRIRDAEVDR